MYMYQAESNNNSILMKVLLLVVIFLVLCPGLLVNIPGRDQALDQDSNSLNLGDCNVASTPAGDMQNESLWKQTLVHFGVFFAVLFLLSKLGVLPLSLTKCLLLSLLFAVLCPGFLVNIPGRDQPLDADSNSLPNNIASTPLGDMQNESLYLQAIVHALVFAIVVLLLSGYLFN